jgi:hypothetical protein
MLTGRRLTGVTPYLNDNISVKYKSLNIKINKETIRI